MDADDDILRRLLALNRERRAQYIGGAGRVGFYEGGARSKSARAALRGGTNGGISQNPNC